MFRPDPIGFLSGVLPAILSAVGLAKAEGLATAGGFSLKADREPPRDQDQPLLRLNQSVRQRTDLTCFALTP